MRKNQAPRRSVLPDPIYNSQTVTKAINKIMLDGKKGLAQKILYGAFDLVKAKTQNDPMEVFRKALDNVIPVLELKFRKIGGANYQIPIEVTEVRKEALALRWLINYARNRHEHTMTERLACEIIDASKNTGASVKKKEDTHKMAEANRAFAHYRW